MMPERIHVWGVEPLLCEDGALHNGDTCNAEPPCTEYRLNHRTPVLTEEYHGSTVRSCPLCRHVIMNTTDKYCAGCGAEFAL